MGTTQTDLLITSSAEVSQCFEKSSKLTSVHSVIVIEPFLDIQESQRTKVGQSSNLTQRFDVIIVGGSYAGLSAALALGRSLRSVLIIDSGKRCNLPVPHSHNFLTHDGARPGDVAAVGKAQVLAYPTVQFLEGVAATGTKLDNKSFVITTEAGQEYKGRKLIFATGLRDIMPKEIKGFDACWGISILHCPYCHGYEARGQKTAILARGVGTMHLVSLVRNLAKDVTILTNGSKPDATPEQLEKLRRNQVNVVEVQIAEIHHVKGEMHSISFADGKVLPFTAMYAGPNVEQHCAIPSALGCGLSSDGHIIVDKMQKTTVSGVWACGDNANQARSIATAVAAGCTAGAAVNMELAGEDF